MKKFQNFFLAVFIAFLPLEICLGICFGLMAIGYNYENNIIIAIGVIIFILGVVGWMIWLGILLDLFKLLQNTKRLRWKNIAKEKMEYKQRFARRNIHS